MRVLVVTPPKPVVLLEEAKLHLRVDGDDEDTLITGLIAAATRGLDGPDGWLGRALGFQTLAAHLAHEHLPSYCFDYFRPWGWRGYSFDLPYPPTRSQDAITVESVVYTPAGGSPVTVDPSLYSLDPAGRRLSLQSCAVPWGGCDLAVTYATGTPIPEGQETAPIADEVRCAILLTVGSLYANREAEAIDSRAVVAPNPAAERLLAPQRIWRL